MFNWLAQVYTGSKLQSQNSSPRSLIPEPIWTTVTLQGLLKKYRNYLKVDGSLHHNPGEEPF